MKKLTESLEKYLKAVYDIVEVETATRVKDVAKSLNIGVASTSEAIKSLQKKGFLNYKPYGVITLTNKGKIAIKEKRCRHEIISDFLETCLMLPYEKIEDASSQIEFSMPEDVLKRFVQYLTFMQNCSCKTPKWKNSFKYYLNEGIMQEKCAKCINDKGTGKNCCGCSN
ncbi:MAG: metal-dependent transcriptional regulator [Candidatus Gastranaerophilales bacterium]|nr:metal-dependent transcriptional regulator [Candidatus Gastranaerophilales bacterium]